MGSIYGTRTKVAVTPFNGSAINYGFATNMDEGDQSVLGHQKVSDVAGIVIYGASAPKPGRMSKTKASGETNTSFVDWQKINDAEAADWKLVKGAVRRPKLGRSRRSVRVKAEIAPNLIKVWDMKLEQFNKVGTDDAAALGVSAYVASDLNASNIVTKENKVEGAILFGAKSDQGQTVGFIGYQQADSAPDGWAVFAKAQTDDPRTPDT
ncbi:hypothetical protein IQ260_19655 [Leptolyngbya cf. ectocarpi LEGE 11479]|uniref:Uncharacterized protein n=1 Tax=Leptolyngbya cf. ectocarpi LEGE 11479 TaxID=1828722 RepID=A0A928ZWS1_LEPEC|nr:hypothetical protein [Leptolyngbya ectocarpi]MBE9068864.1 hypothetical protein [Leptolyngbya cf. ectocarpi LEGE 11479]